MILGLLAWAIMLTVLMSMCSMRLRPRYVRTLNIPLGTKTFKGYKQDEIQYVPVGRFGVYLVIARSRSGKSCIVKSTLAFISNWSDRPILVLDPYGEYAKCIHPNFRSRPYSMGFKNFRVIENLTFKIRDFRAIDWVSLGFSETAAQVLEQIAEREDLHNNNFDTFKEIIDNIPTKKNKDALAFQRRYGTNMILHSQTDAQLKLKLEWYRDYFMEDDGKGNDIKGRFYSNNYAELLDKNNLIINLSMRKGDDKARAVSFAGIILRQIKPYLPYLKPVVVVEEADLLCGNPTPEANVAGGFLPSCAIELSDYTIKLQRDDVVVWYIVQDHSLLYPVLAHNWHYKVLGILDPRSRDAEYTHGLQNDFISRPGAWREFVLLSASNKINRFVPLDCPCQI